MTEREKEMKNKLICPFCGGKVHIVVCDDEGNIQDKEYEKNPWSGLGYLIVHEEKDVPKDKNCPIATFDYDDSSLGTHIYDTKEDAMETWQNNEISRLTAENDKLRARLGNAIELPTMSEFKIVDLHTNFYQISYAVLYKSKGKLYIYQCFDKAKAEEKLKEVGGNV